LRVELHYFRGCPHADAARALLRRCIDQLGLEVPVLELEGDHPSPSILVDGRDVMGEPPTRGRSCRLDVPSESRLLSVLRASIGGSDAA
jgi:hypothetical protein